MNKIVTVFRFLFALMFIFFGTAYFLGLLPTPTAGDKVFLQLYNAMEASYLLPFVKLTEIVGGILLLSNFLAPLGLAVLAPITLNILVFNLTLQPSLTVLSLILILIHTGLTWNYRERFMLLFRKETISSKATSDIR